MIQKAILNEDHQIMNVGIQKTLNELGVKKIENSFDCLSAYNKIKTALRENTPFQLLITDLHFGKRSEKIGLRNGFDLIQTLREEKIPIFIISLSIERNPLKIKNLLDKWQVEGYILKGKNDRNELRKAIESLDFQEKLPYLSSDARLILKNKNVLTLTEFDIQVLKLLVQGYKQSEIPAYLKEHDFNKTSLRSVESRLEKLRQTFAVNTNNQLIATLKDLQLL